MNEKTKSNAPKWFTITNVLMLLWNLAGLAMFGMMMSMVGNKEALAKVFPEQEKIDLMLATPAWVNIAFAVGVICGTLGCAALLMRKKLAVPLLVLSLLGVLAQNAYVFFMSNSVEVMGTVGMAPLVILISIALIPYAMYGAKQGWLR